MINVYLRFCNDSGHPQVSLHINSCVSTAHGESRLKSGSRRSEDFNFGKKWSKSYFDVFWSLTGLKTIEQANLQAQCHMGTVECPVKSREERWMCTTNKWISDWGDKRACEGTDLDHPAWDRTLTDHQPSLPTLAQVVDDPFVVNFRSPVSHGQGKHYVEDLKGDFLHKHILWGPNGRTFDLYSSFFKHLAMMTVDAGILNMLPLHRPFGCMDRFKAHHCGVTRDLASKSSRPSQLSKDLWSLIWVEYRSEKRVSEIKCFISRDFLNPHIYP